MPMQPEEFIRVIDIKWAGMDFPYISSDEAMALLIHVNLPATLYRPDIDFSEAYVGTRFSTKHNGATYYLVRCAAHKKDKPIKKCDLGKFIYKLNLARIRLESTWIFMHVKGRLASISMDDMMVKMMLLPYSDIQLYVEWYDRANNQVFCQN